MMQRRRVLAALLSLPAIALAANRTPANRTPAQEIELLIQRVAASKGVVFIRNGSEHSAANAAQHLRRKLKAAKGRITTPDQFIAQLATRSSITGKPYSVRLPDGREMESAAWLHGLLRDVRASR